MPTVRSLASGMSTAMKHCSKAAPIGYDVLVWCISPVERADHTKETRTQMTEPHDIAGNAALTICESLMLALNDLDIIPEKKIMGILKDAATTHENVPHDDGRAPMHKEVALLIHKIIDGRNSVRRP